MKTPILLIFIFVIFCSCSSPQGDDITADKAMLEKTKAAMSAAFARGDVAAIVALHHPDVIKYFGGDNVVTGRAALAKQLTAMFHTSKIELIQNKVESSVFNGSTAIESCIFAFKITPANGGTSSIARGRSMTIFAKYKDSPYGWVSLREMTQAAPAVPQ